MSQMLADSWIFGIDIDIEHITYILNSSKAQYVDLNNMMLGYRLAK
jgi:hypothetical protein